ncbi:von Willebrand factor A domain-containing protein 8 [Coccinella septempunctata]|uniref:von Willebrand factor A domain-containing protein 8 n=1 Tax=Coccinella septempunctata TaxID=41139 RepID=UPI001D085578|nr:von Willebrand factor A domain-containing protein 8 [Coccinella septempunctata]
MFLDRAAEKLRNLNRILHRPNFSRKNLNASYSTESVTIGDITKEIKSVQKLEYVPRKYYSGNENQSTLHHLQWMMKKDLLGQDIFLLGPPGPSKRHLAMQYLELTNRELEYISLSRDTTESDLKQRREIIDGTAKYFDQSAVRAATEGRVLVLDGIEKAERNVLPVLNNLLENREMHLEDGRSLIPAHRYDELLEKYGEEEMNKWKLVRVDENFRVIAIGLPVPRYRGNPLDPPLRSRFQARDVNMFSYQEYLTAMKEVAPNVPHEKLESILSAAFSLRSEESTNLSLPEFPVESLILAARLLEQNPKQQPFDILYKLYPYRTFLKDGIQNLESLLSRFNITPPEDNLLNTLSSKFKMFFSKNANGASLYVETPYQNQVIEDMVQTIGVSDYCIVGPKGCGKSLLVNKVSEILGQETETIVLYQDMTSRDLIQQRSTLDNGDTIWVFSPLVNAALEGKIAILDGIHRIHPSTLSVLHRLVHDRELQLHDGKRLMSYDRYSFLRDKLKISEADLTKSGIFPIHPNFRIVAIGEPPNNQSNTNNWMTSEVLSLFLFHELRTLSKQEEMNIIVSQFGPISRPLHQIIDLAHTLRNSTDPTLKNLAGHLSTRQLMRIAARMKNYPTDPYEALEETFMIQFLPSLAKKALEKTISKVGINPNPEESAKKLECDVKDGVLTIGKTSCNVYVTDHLTKVPHILFYNVPQHIKLMEKLLQEFLLGQHLLLVGNQGVGKNKIVDRFLELMNRPREYIQLHRDTTVQTLTTQPSVKDGVLIHEDSPLVKAVKQGHILVVDEADKAPTHVTCILKSLVETGQMILSDGRRIVKKVPEGADFNKYIEIHPDFRVIVLANRPGFPFLGNDFFGALGDLFSSHAVENPSKDSEISLLNQYGPDVPLDVLKKLVTVFGELRTMADTGLVSYPYSTREVVNIIKHLQQFPDADIEDVMFNVFDFDKYNPEMVQTLGEILVKHGIAKKNIFSQEYLAKKRAQKDLQVTVNRYSGLDTSGPKHGKEDPNNDPHVGGNTWAGGTGGRDTAGLGGKGGPYRLDKGHKVHQLSDEEKNAVPEHVQRAAREMGRKAFEQRLKEIGMSGYDASLYSQFSNSVSREVQSLRVILGNLQAKNKERMWTRHQTSGELDDVKLIDGILGEKTIFRRRVEEEPELGTPQIRPKLFRVLADVSGSMYRFNGYDGRLDRELEAVVLVMEAFEGFEDKIKYDILGHSGDSPNITFVRRDRPPKNNKERLDVIRTMHAHSQYCWSGDHTLSATQSAVASLAEDDCDEAILVVLSDANLQRYGIPPSKLADALSSSTKVSAYAIFIGSLGNQAEMLIEKLPVGRSFVCTDVSELPHILKQIFTSSLIQSKY